jgi:hypothetical protein
MLLNPGLETPFVAVSSGRIATGWTNKTYFGASLLGAQETNNVHGGASCQEMIASGLVGTNNVLFYQPFTFLPGHVYNARVWLRAASSSLVQFYLRNSDNYYQAGASAIVTVGTNWQQVVINGGFQNGANAQFAVSFLSNGTNWMDDASLTDVTANYLNAPLANTTSVVPATLFGMHINMLTAKNNWPPLQQGLIRFWDVGLNWNNIQTNAGPINWSRFDAGTNVVWTNNPSCKVLYTFGHTPQWAALNPNATNAKGVADGSSSEPRDMNDWSNFVQAVATRYKGFIQYYEVWNETDYPGFYSGAISNMVTIARIARNVITNIDPAAKILGPNITLGGLGWLEQFIQAGGPAPDIATFHNYTTYRPEDSLGEVAGVRDLLSRYPQWSALPLWCTEGAVQTNPVPEVGPATVARAYLFWWTQNIPNWNWYAWELTNVSGSLRVPLSVSPPSQTPAAGGIAYSNTVNWLIGAQMTDKAIDANGTWMVELQRQGFRSSHIVWNPDTNAVFSIPASWNVYQQRDLSNHVTSLTGVASVTAGVAPVILDSLPSLAIVSTPGHNTVNLSWPSSAAGFNLYTTTNLVPAVWLPVTNAATIQESLFQVTVMQTNVNRFFRLSSP